MDASRPTEDYYAVLQVAPGCDAEVLEKAYRHLAQRFHPDHSATADVEKFTEITQAYSVLRNPEKRAAYDKLHGYDTVVSPNPYSGMETPPLDDREALADAEVHEKILNVLYKRRREHAGNPGVGPFAVQEIADCSYEEFEFHSWYLKSKGYIETTEEGTIAITVEGVDHVISMSRHAEEQKLLSTRQDRSED